MNDGWARNEVRTHNIVRTQKSVLNRKQIFNESREGLSSFVPKSYPAKNNPGYPVFEKSFYSSHKRIYDPRDWN